MEKAFRFGRTAASMRVTGSRTWQTGRADSFIQMEMSTKVTGLLTRLMDKGLTSTRTVHATVENGLRTNSTD